MINIRIQNKGTSPEVFLEGMRGSVNQEGKEKTFEISEEVVQYIRQYIFNSKKRPSMGNNLENTIDSEIIEDTKKRFIVGIGNIEKLKTDAPYFEVLDAGGYIPNYGNLVPLGNFAPGESIPDAEHFREGNWEIAGRGHTFRAKRPIEGINYVSEGIKELKKKLNQDLITWMQEQTKQSSRHGYGMGSGGAK